MSGSYVEITQGNRHLHLERGFFVVSENKEEVGRLPFDAIEAVIINAHGISITNNLICELGIRGIPVIFCANNHKPTSFLWPVEGNHRQSSRMRAQIEADKPLGKRLWKDIVQGKLQAHLAVLKAFGVTSEKIKCLIPEVRSGDPENIEAQAARIYWPLLMGEDFKRDTERPGINSFLNYGYAILRAAAARAVMAAGLHPSIGIHHSNPNNAMLLVDDLMEPFRPFVDGCVKKLTMRGEKELNTTVKRKLVKVASLPFASAKGQFELKTCLENLAISFAQILEGTREELELPDMYKQPIEQNMFDLEDEETD